MEAPASYKATRVQKYKSRDVQDAGWGNFEYHATLRSLQTLAGTGVLRYEKAGTKREGAITLRRLRPLTEL